MHNSTMTDAQRAERLFELYQQLDELITADEKVTYPFIQHLEDLINDLME